MGAGRPKSGDVKGRMLRQEDDLSGGGAQVEVIVVTEHVRVLSDL
jgi:hypothetical protein